MNLNVERLNTYKSKMILFPRRDGKPRRGEINDSTAEQLKSAAASQQASGHILPIARAQHGDEFRAIGEAAKNNVFRTQRILRTVRRYKGRREKKAKDAAEEQARQKVKQE